MSKRLVVIDGKSVFYRGYYSMPNLSMKDGTPTGGVYGFSALALEVIRKLKPDYVAVAWDKPKTNIRRRVELYPGYKANRKPAPADFYEQIPVLHDLLKAFGWPLYECDDYEADDIMGALAVAANERDIEACLVTSDLDMLQLIGPKTHVYAMKKGFTNIELYNPESFEQKYGIRVDQFLDLKALKGDSSDSIPGVPGIGEKTAIELLKKYETLDGVYENLWEIKDSTRKKLEAGKDSAYLSKEIARIWIDAPIPFSFEDMDVNSLDTEQLATLLGKLEFKSLLRNLPTHMQNGSTPLGAPKAPAITPLEVQEWVKDSDINTDPKEPATYAFYVSQEASQLWYSRDRGPVYTIGYNDLSLGGGEQYQMVLQAFTGNNRSAVGHDIKAQEKLLGQSIKVTRVKHDTELAGFLLNSLERDRSISNLLDTDIDMTQPGQVMAAIWQLYDKQKEQFNELPKVAWVARELDFPLITILSDIESRGIKLDTDFLKNMSTELAERIAKIQSEMFELVGYEFNIGSPAQLAEVLFTKLQLPTFGIKKGKTGYSTGQKELDKLRGQHPIVELIEQFRELSKLKNTYVDPLPIIVDANKRLHTTFNQDVASTGRLSSTDPNLQNIPIRTEIGRKIRRAFIAEPGKVFVSADYSQFELRLAAVLAGDKQMIEDFNGDLDIHTKTASDVFKVPLKDVTKDQRRAAKVINFGVLYGMSPHGLSAATGMSFHDSKIFIDEYFKLRAPIRKYIDETLEKAKEQGCVETLFGRRRPTPDVKSSNWVIREAAKRAAANMPIQGTEADLMKMAMIKVEEQLLTPNKKSVADSKTPDEPLGWQVLQIHDSILVECPQENALAVERLLKETMENIYPELGIKLKVDVSTGSNWGEL